MEATTMVSDYAPAEQDQVHNMDWVQDKSVLDAEVDFFAGVSLSGSPIVKPNSAARPNIS
ncbi:hypothetical protein PENSUB_6699 [Penicillium subrubescens]|uniref:Uncharacterized protein n=1 Tax=Penicillium subrubescens TaxID=1316194 RepID=A0A1Q5TXI9_9EURO|nr:hypothetical protein PENSUB_6699 [Penicillium subrubescens]